MMGYSNSSIQKHINILLTKESMADLSTPDAYNPKTFSYPKSMTHAYEAVIESAVEKRWLGVHDQMEAISEWTKAKKLALDALEEQIQALQDDTKALEKAAQERFGNDKQVYEIKVRFGALKMAWEKIVPHVQAITDELKEVTSSSANR